MGCKNKKNNILMEWERKRGKEGRERWDSRERIDLFILFVGIVYIILMSSI